MVGVLKSAVTKLLERRTKNWFSSKLWANTFHSFNISSQNGTNNFVLFNNFNRNGVITLNRPLEQNTLDINMVQYIHSVLQRWKFDNTKLIIAKSTGGKFFCGGSYVSNWAKTNDFLEYAKNYNREKCKLISLIATLPKPYIALMDGYAIGSGVGLGVLGKYCVATERSQFRSPEVSLGVVPLFGGTFMLPRLRGQLGLYLALTCKSLKGIDIYKAGIATHMCSSSKLEMLEKDLMDLQSDTAEDIEYVLNQYNEKYPDRKKPFSLERYEENINAAFDASTVEEIISNLKEDSSDWAKQTLRILTKMSPTSLKVTFKLFKMGQQMDLLESLATEKILCDRGNIHDFFEGFRTLAEKDLIPKWSPNTLDEVTLDIVDNYFYVEKSKAE